jgi:hypothetical protein
MFSLDIQLQPCYHINMNLSHKRLTDRQRLVVATIVNDHRRKEQGGIQHGAMVHESALSSWGAEYIIEALEANAVLYCPEGKVYVENIIKILREENGL